MKRFDLEIPFNRPTVVGGELRYVSEAMRGIQLSGGGVFADRCQEWLERKVGTVRALLTPSCTAALELSALLADVGPGDEVVMPSFTFTATATAFVLRGATPVFVDIRPDTLNIDEELAEEASGPRTRAIVAVHYAGVAAENDALRATADRCGAVLVEDAAQAIGSTYRGRPVGGDGDFAALSFHETKNVTCGEGGALLLNDPATVARAEVMQEKGTDRARLFRGEIDRYTWVDIGSSFLLSELAAAFLWAQFEEFETVQARRLPIWDAYHDAFADLEAAGRLRRPIVPPHCGHNAHLYYLLLPDAARRDGLIAHLRESGIAAVFHYLPLHDSTAGRRFGRAHGDLSTTVRVSECLVRLPLWTNMPEPAVTRVVDAVREYVLQ